MLFQNSWDEFFEPVADGNIDKRGRFLPAISSGPGSVY